MAPRGGKRQNAGRKAPAGVRLSKTIRFSEEELVKIKLYSKQVNTNQSNYIRHMALSYETLKEVNELLITIKNFSNQDSISNLANESIDLIESILEDK